MSTTNHQHHSQAPNPPSTYLANFSATASSPQSTAPFSVVPSVIAFLCAATNCRFARCSSGSVTRRAGSSTRTFTCPCVAEEEEEEVEEEEEEEEEEGRERETGPPSPPEAACSAMIAATMAVDVCSSVRSASEGAFGTYTSENASTNERIQEEQG